MRRGPRLFLLALALVFFDQSLKWWFTKASADWGFVSFHFVQNTGSSFGLLKGFGPYLMWLSVIVLGLILFFFDRVGPRLQIPVAMVAAGVAGNLLDRARLGYVVDFIDLGWWPVFNVADACISIGVAWIVVEDLLRGRKNQKSRRSARTAA